jgi:two-component system LytT family sensor kinase
MRFFKKYFFPAIYGLLVYFTIRLLHDIDVEARFWTRDWGLNAFEIACSILLGYLSIWLFKLLFRYCDRRWPLPFSYQNLVNGLLLAMLGNLVLVNVVFVPMAALTDDGLSWADFVGLNVIPALYTIIYYGIARSRIWLNAYVDSRLQVEKLTHEQLETELKFLKAQYHPHFLFNALNTIYFQMDADLSGAKRSIEKFSELLRYQLYDQQQQVPVIREIEYLQSYIELQKTRSTSKLKLEVRIDPNLNEQLVYPLLFLPFVENAFKFVGGDYHLLVKASLEDDYIKFKVENSVSDVIQSENKAGGIGLENLSRRLKLLYPDRHQLKIEQHAEVFRAELSLNYEQ